MKPLFNFTVDDLQKYKIIDWGYTEELSARTYHHFESWLKKGVNEPLHYLEGKRGKIRESLIEFYPEAKSAISFLFDYTPAKKTMLSESEKTKIASYTMGFEGEDYHFWIGRRLEEIGKKLKDDIFELDFKLTLDIHPVLERDLAYRAGLGWFGKNTMLISKSQGSYFIIGSLIFNQKLDFESRNIEADHCGTCTRCIDACPTNAISKDFPEIITDRCISTHTIEVFKDETPPKGYPTTTHEIFGCDICQDVCPWNSKPLARASSEVIENKFYDFFSRDINIIYSEIKEMSNNEFKRFFHGSSFFRSGKRGLLKNLRPYLNL